jgi:DNA-binding transcriptional MerR regulator
VTEGERQPGGVQDVALTLTRRERLASGVEVELMQRAAEFTVGEVARLASVTVRTLHHYHEIGLLTPSLRTSAGYRQYDESDLQRLHRILGYRELGFSLEEIADILAEAVDMGEHLRRQRALLNERIARLQRMAANVERTLEAHMTGINLTPEEIFEVFGDVDPLEHAEEAERRWGATDAYTQSRRRTGTYGKVQWGQIKTEGDAMQRSLAEVFQSGAAPDSIEAMDAVEEHRAHIAKWFYEVPYAMHRGLGELYITDPRFTANYEHVASGLAQWMRDAIQANADRHESA